MVTFSGPLGWQCIAMALFYDNGIIRSFNFTPLPSIVLAVMGFQWFFFQCWSLVEDDVFVEWRKLKYGFIGLLLYFGIPELACHKNVAKNSAKYQHLLILFCWVSKIIFLHQNQGRQITSIIPLLLMELKPMTFQMAFNGFKVNNGFQCFCQLLVQRWDSNDPWFKSS